MCLQNDYMVLKNSLKMQLAENGHIAAQTGEPSPSYHDEVIQADVAIVEKAGLLGMVKEHS